MSDTWPIILRDPVHNLIAFHADPWDRLLLGMLNTLKFQRLGRIKQPALFDQLGTD